MGAPHVTPEEVIEMHQLYRQLGSYAKVAERVNRSPSTVRKYILMIDVPTAIRVAVQTRI